MTLPQLLRTFLLDKLGMSDSGWLLMENGNPHLAAAMEATGDDYDKMLQAVLTYDPFPKELIDQMEADAYYTYPGLAPAQNVKDLSLEFYGHYSMCLYYECVNQVNFTDECEAKAVHADPGAFGYWPLINRPKEYYMQIVVERHVTLPQWALDRFNISQADVAALAGQCVSPIRYNIQPAVEAALAVPVDPPLHYRLQYPLNEICRIASQNPSEKHSAATSDALDEGGAERYAERRLAELRALYATPLSQLLW